PGGPGAAGEEGGEAADAGGVVGEAGDTAISSNPGAVNIITGTGALGRFLGIDPDTGVRIGGLWIGDANAIMTGGISPGHWGIDTLGLIDFNVDTEKAL